MGFRNERDIEVAELFFFGWMVLGGSDGDEEQMLRDLRAGKQEAFQRLLDRHQRRVYNLAYRMLNHHASDAEDATQEIFLEVYRSLPRFAGRSRLDTWIHRIAVNVCLQKRRRKHLETVELTDADHLETPAQGEAYDPVARLERGELREALAQAVAALPDGQREVVLLHGMQGLTHSEVAEVLECPLGTVKSRLSTAFRRLRAALPGLAETGGMEVRS